MPSTLSPPLPRTPLSSSRSYLLNIACALLEYLTTIRYPTMGLESNVGPPAVDHVGLPPSPRPTTRHHASHTNSYNLFNDARSDAILILEVNSLFCSLDDVILTHFDGSKRFGPQGPNPSHRIYCKPSSTPLTYQKYLRKLMIFLNSYDRPRRNLPGATRFPSALSGITIGQHSCSFLRVLQDVATTLESLSSRYGTRNRGLREWIKFFLDVIRDGRCTQVLRKCEGSVSRAATVLRVRTEA